MEGDSLLSVRLLDRRSVEGPLLCSARSMAILMSSTHFSISDDELEESRERLSSLAVSLL